MLISTWRRPLAAHINHFYKAVMEANEYPGPAVVNVYTTCQPEHGVPDCNSARQAKMAVDSRAFPIFIYDPRKGERIRERLRLVGNPSHKEDWWTPPKTEKILPSLFARTEGRFTKQFDGNGNPIVNTLANPRRAAAELAHASRAGRAARSKTIARRHDRYGEIHGRAGLQRLLLGSVAERTLRYADCPVLIVKK